MTFCHCYVSFITYDKFFLSTSIDNGCDDMNNEASYYYYHAIFHIIQYFIIITFISIMKHTRYKLLQYYTNSIRAQARKDFFY